MSDKKGKSGNGNTGDGKSGNGKSGDGKSGKDKTPPQSPGKKSGNGSPGKDKSPSKKSEKVVTSEQKPGDKKSECLAVCKMIFPGVWQQLNVSDIETEQIVGGVANVMYKCRVKEEKLKSIKEKPSEPTEVAIKFYGPKNPEIFIKEKQVLNDHIVSREMSIKKIGAKILGISHQNQIIEFVKHHHFGADDEKNEALVLEVARQLARMHATQLPLVRDPNRIIDLIKKQKELGYRDGKINDIIKEKKCQTLKQNPIDKEVEWITKQIKQINCQICFVHNDFRKPNIMVMEDNKSVLFCDFEDSAYGYRGRDFGTFFVEWGRKVPEEYSIVKEFPNDSVLKPFIKEYITETKKVTESETKSGTKRLSDGSPKNASTEEQILREAKLFALVSFLQMTTACLYIDYPGVPKDVLINAGEMQYQNYMKAKKQFLDDKTLN